MYIHPFQTLKPILQYLGVTEFSSLFCDYFSQKDKQEVDFKSSTEQTFPYGQETLLVSFAQTGQSVLEK